MDQRNPAVTLLCAALPLLGAAPAAPPAQADDSVQRQVAPPGQATSAKTKTLEAGAIALQGNAPVKGFDIYLVGFHPMKEHPEQLFDTLPPEERKYWHPHNGEILSGQLVAPGIPDVAEKALMKEKMNSYGKTWHFWNTGHAGQAGDRLPLGDPMLAWSFNRDGEALPGLVERRDRAMDISTAQKRKERTELQPLAHPQSGVDDLKGKFGRPARDIPGVVDKRQTDSPAPHPAQPAK